MDKDQQRVDKLWSLIEVGDWKAVKNMINQGMNLNYIDDNGKSFIHMMAEKSYLDVLQLLHENGANLKAKDRNDRSMIMHAIKGICDCKTITWLLKQDVEVNHCDKHGFTAVHYAAEKGNLDVLKLLQINGANIHQVSSNQSNAIISALMGNGSHETVKWLLEQGVDVNHSDEYGFTAALHAAEAGNLDVLKLLQSNGANIHCVSTNGTNGIISASMGTGSCETVMWLIEQGIDVNHCDKDGFTAALHAADEGNLDVLKLLQSNGASINQVSNNGTNDIMSASMGTGSCETVMWLIEQGIDVNHCDKDGFTAALHAADEGNLDVLKLLQSNGASINHVSTNGTNGIISASMGTGSCETVMWLIEQGIDVNHCDKDGFTAVHHAAQGGHLDLLKLLQINVANIHQVSSNGTNAIISALWGTGSCETVMWLIEQGVDVNHCGGDGLTAVLHAADEGNLDVLKLLQSNGASINHVSNNGTNAIMLASMGTGSCETVMWLIEQGVDVNHCGGDGFTAVLHAADEGNLDVLKLLQSNGASINHVSTNGTNGIISASMGTGSCETVMWLIEQGIDVNHCDKDGFTAVHRAAQGGHLDLLKLLQINVANIHQVSSNGTNAIISALWGTGSCETVMWLIEQGVDVNHCGGDGLTAVLHAADEGNLDVLKLLQSNGASINHVSNNGTNAIMLASMGTGSCETVMWLIQQGVDVNHCGGDGFTAVLHAADEGNLDVLKLLQSNGASINHVSTNGTNGIISASMGTGSCETVMWLIEQGIDVNHCDKDGFTAVHRAAQGGHLDLLKLLQINVANIHQVSSNGTNAIISALWGTGSCETVMWLIEQGVDVNHCGGDGLTAVLHAADEGNLDVLKLLQSNGASINHVSNNGTNAIMLASMGTGSCETVMWLIEQGVDVNHCGGDGFTAVLHAADEGNLDVLKLLQSNGASINHVSTNGTNGIISASMGTGSCETVMWLIEQGIDVNHCDKDGFTAVHRAAQGGHLDLLKLLQINVANIHQVSSNGTNAIISALWGTGSCETVMWLIEQGVNVNHCDIDGFTGVHDAAYKGNLDVLKILDSSGANICQVNSNGINSIMSASMGTGSCETVRWLLEQGVDVNHSNKHGFTAVHCAAEKGNLDVLKLLHSNGANIDQVTIGDMNSIMSASQGTGSCETVRWLVGQGVDVNHSDKDGFTAVHYAAEKDNLDVLKLLHNSGANIHQVNRNGIISLMSASLGTGSCDTVRWLLEQGVDVNHSNKDGFTAVHYAAEKGNLDVLKLLHSKRANITQVSSEGINAIMSVSLSNGDCVTAKWLIDHGLEKSQCTNNGVTAIHFAARMNHISLLKLLKQHSFDINSLDVQKNDALIWNTFGKGDKMIVQWLINEGLDANYSNIHGNCALHFASYFGMLLVVQMLCSMGANINNQNNHCLNALQFAAFGKNALETVMWLIENNIEVSNLNDEGMSALHYAATQNQTEILKYIAGYDKRISLKSCNG